MGPKLKLAILLVWLPQAIYQIPIWLYWWQTKEYRVDRLKLLLLSRSGRKSLQLSITIFKILLLLPAIFIQKLLWINIPLFIILDLRLPIKILQKRLRRPVFTLRAKEILAASLIFILPLAFAILTSDASSLAFFLFLGELSALLSPSWAVLATTPPVNQIKKREIKKAQKKLEEIKPIVIGVTGSYGKTTTKEFIAHLLSQKYRAAKTTGSENTKLGIARKTVRFLKRSTRFFIVEMGAYKRGEIKALTQIAKPQVGVITGATPTLEVG